MDQVKEYLKIAVKYRFWIIVGVAALLPIIGYFSAAGAIAETTVKKTNEIKGAESGVKGFVSGTIPNPKWTQLTEQKKAVLAVDVNKSWKKLYDRQAPLLDWPPQVEKEFREWGDQWPKNVDRSQVDFVINRYVQVYPDYVTRVYESFHPWNSETGEGIVVTVPKDELLRPAVFDVRNPPTLSKVHVAQKRLWIQRTMLDVVRVVNEKAGAKDWDTARIKQITALEVASGKAQDQKSAAQGKVLEPPAEIVDPAAPPAAAASTASTGGVGGREGMGMPGKGGSGTDPATVEFLKSDAPDQYFVVPVALGVLIDQDHIFDLLVEFENSPMSIQVVDFDWERTGSRVQKPVKGETISLGSFGNLGSREGVLGMPGKSGMAGRGMGGPMSGEAGLNGGGGYRPGLGGQSSFQPKSGRDVKDQQLAAIREKEKAEADAKKKSGADKKGDHKHSPNTNTIADPFFNIVEVHIYGQARFYRKPPDEAPPPPTGPSTPAPPAPPEPPKVEAAKPPEPPADAKKAEPAKAEEPKKDEPAKDAAKTDAPKADAAKADAPKADAPKDDAAKAEPKPDAKAEAPKADQKKDDAPKP